MSFVNIKKLEQIGDFITDCDAIGGGDCETCNNDNYCRIYSDTMMFLYYIRKLGKAMGGKKMEESKR